MDYQQMSRKIIQFFDSGTRLTAKRVASLLDLPEIDAEAICERMSQEGFLVRHGTESGATIYRIQPGARALLAADPPAPAATIAQVRIGEVHNTGNLGSIVGAVGEGNQNSTELQEGLSAEQVAQLISLVSTINEAHVSHLLEETRKAVDAAREAKALKRNREVLDELCKCANALAACASVALNVAKFLQGL